MAARLPLAGERDALPLAPARTVDFDVDEGSWMSLDVSPDGETIVFDLLGCLYVLPVRGGRAKPITGGMGFCSQPTFSADGARIAFVSDASGAENLWIAAVDGSQARAITANDSANAFVSPAWAADGDSLFASIYRADRNAIELWRFPLDGVPAEAMVEGRLGALGAAASPDGRFVYYAAREGPVFEDEVILPRWRIDRLELATKRRESVVTHPGSAMRPVLSRDGNQLIYGARWGGHTGLRLRELHSGADQQLAWPIDRDAQEALPTRDLLPGHAFSPDGRAALVAFGGKINRIAIGSGRARTIPFRARISRGIGPSLRRDIPEEAGPVRARIIADPSLSPDGKRLAFGALANIHVMDLAHGKPRRAAPGPEPQFMPAWSPDGRALAYVTWTAAGAGHVWLVGTETGAKPRRLSSSPAFYTHPVFTPDGGGVVALRSSHYERIHLAQEPVFTGRALGGLRQADLVQISLTGGAERVLASGMIGGVPHFGPGPGEVFVLFEDGLTAVSLDGSRRRHVLRVVGPGYYFLEGPQPADDIRISPDGRWALVQHVQQLHLVAVRPGRAGTIDLSRPSAAHRKLTSVGADFCAWADGGATITWALGAKFWRRPLASVAPKSARARLAPCRPKPGEGGVEAHATVVEIPRDKPGGMLVLRGATAIPMVGEETVHDADVLIEDGRIAGFGRRGEVAIPEAAEIRDLTGAFVLPGFIDTHAHWGSIRRGVIDLRDWSLEAALAWGVTASLDPSTLSIDLLTYQDLQEAGLIRGPRLYSTGVALFSFNRFASLDEVRDVLSRYAVDYRLGNLKQYRTGNRRVRQWVAMAARELGLMPTTEGALDMKLDLTQVIDGFAGSEHALSPAPLFQDVIRLFAEARTSYTLTLQCTHGGPPAMNAFIQAAAPMADAKVKRFFPPFMLDRLFTRGPWSDGREYIFGEVAAGAAKLHRAGGLVGVGSHGNVAGLGQHWEMHAYAAGGMSPHEVLHAGTLGSAETIGRRGDLGSLEVGKLADLVVLDRDPLADIRNTLSIRQVMQNGRLYDADTLDELWPRRRLAPPPWFAGEGEP